MLFWKVTVYELYLCLFGTMVGIDHNGRDYIRIFGIDIRTESIILPVDVFLRPTEAIDDRIDIIDIRSHLTLLLPHDNLSYPIDQNRNLHLNEPRHLNKNIHALPLLMLLPSPLLIDYALAVPEITPLVLRHLPVDPLLQAGICLPAD